MVTKMQRLEAEVQMYAGQDLSQLSDLERAAVFLVARSDALRRRMERRRKRKKQRKKKLPRAPRPRCRRLCVHQRQVPAVRSSVVTQRQVPTVHSFMLPVQFLDTVFDMPVVVDALAVQVVRFHRLYISVYSAMLGSTVHTNFCVSLLRFSRFST